MTRLTLAGTASFLLWGLLHIAGGAAILLALTEGPDAAYAFYRHDAETIPVIAGAALGYLAYGFVAAGIAVSGLAVTRSRRNDPTALAINTVLILVVEFGLVLFLLVPGHLGVADAAPGLVLAAAGIVFGGMACRGGNHAENAG